jgi:hypothetical protein
MTQLGCMDAMQPAYLVVLVLTSAQRSACKTGFSMSPSHAVISHVCACKAAWLIIATLSRQEVRTHGHDILIKTLILLMVPILILVL